MAMTNYQPLKLNQSNRYPGYQFWSWVRIDGMDATETFHFVVLKIYEWLKEKLPEEDRKAPEMQVPAPEEYASVTEGLFKPYHTSIGFSLDITPLQNEGIWSLRIKEADGGTSERQAVVNRFFTTRVGVRLNDRGVTELGVKIDITDPASEEKEMDYAFRPGFMRRLGKQPEVHFEQGFELKYGKPYKVETEEEYKNLLYILDSEDNQLPLAVFTHVRPGEEKPGAKMSMDAFVKNFDPMKGGVPPVGMPGMGFPGMKSPMPAAAPVKKDEPPVLPYDTVAFSKVTFSFAVTFELGDKFTEKFRNRVKKDFRPGDILLCGAKKFRGGVSVFVYPGENEKAREKTFAEATLAAESYSKHKAYSFGTVVFEAEARNMEQHARVMELINSSTLAEKDKIGEQQYYLQLLLNVIDDKDEDIRKLEAQKNEAYDRGYSSAKQEIEKLKDDINDLKRERDAKQATIDRMADKSERYDRMEEALAGIRSTAELPETNEAVVQYYKAVYGDRLVFTKNGEESATLCRFKPASLWKILYIASHQLVDVFADCGKPEGPSEEEVQASTGYRMSFREGSETRDRAELMKLREDVYEGETISIEPHLKLRASKGELENQRLHFYFDRKRNKVVVGYIGEHLESVSSWRR